MGETIFRREYVSVALVACLSAIAFNVQFNWMGNKFIRWYEVIIILVSSYFIVRFNSNDITFHMFMFLYLTFSVKYFIYLILAMGFILMWLNQ